MTSLRAGTLRAATLLKPSRAASSRKDVIGAVASGRLVELQPPLLAFEGELNGSEDEQPFPFPLGQQHPEPRGDSATR
jgi:hypothetical protein